MMQPLDDDNLARLRVAVGAPQRLVVDPPTEYFDDPPAPAEVNLERIRADGFLAAYAILSDGKGSVELKLLAMGHILGQDLRPLRAIAAEQGVSVSTLHAAIQRLRECAANLGPNKFSEVKDAANRTNPHL
ncbi:MAG: hypothetical protein WDO13_06190 [Verrucomicrobiota bacterium]